MNGTTLERPDVTAYLDAVRAKLADLPAEERDDLVADVEASMLESGEPPALPPEEFAAELREAAGLSSQPPVPVTAHSPLDGLRAWYSSERVAAWRSTARELAPIWWLARAYVAVAVLALAVGWGWPVGSGTSGNSISFVESFIALLVAAATSIWLGLRSRRREMGVPRLRGGINVALAVALLPVAAHSIDKLSNVSYSQYAASYEPTPGVAVDGVPVLNLYPYSREGEPLFDVLLYDENGYPLDLSGMGDPLRRILVGTDGTQYFNSFPIRYFEPGTTRVAQPELAPQIEVPRIETPPLEIPKR